GVDEGLARAPERRTDPRTATRRPPAQEVRGGPIRTIGVEARRRDVVGEGQQRVLERSGGYDLLTEHCRRMDVRRPRSLPDVDGSRGEIDALHPAEIRVVATRGPERVAVIQRRLLRREAIPMHGHLLSLRRLRQLAPEL